MFLKKNSYHIVFCGVQVFQKTGCGPTTTEHHDGLFFWIKRELTTRMFIFLSDIIKTPNASKYGNKGSSTKNLRKPAPFGFEGW